MPKLHHSGGSDDAPFALSNALAAIAHQTDAPISTAKQILAPTAADLPDYPMVFVHGRRDFKWSSAERKALRDYILNGGVVFADAICASDAFAVAFRREMRRILPQHRLQEIPPSDEPLHT